MCGILGLWYRRDRAATGWFHGALQTLRSRGPDGEGVEQFADGRVMLGHKRLAIIDIGDDGRQPLCNEHRTVWISFNGEIYNYRQLRRELAELGHHFRSQSDTEVIVHAYEQWGEDCVHRLDGIFAFGIWDDKRRKLFLARDHLGVKPLYYTTNREPFCFASQPKAILEDPTLQRTMDADAFRDYLAFGYVPDPNCIFQHIQKLPPAHSLTVTIDDANLKRYWTCQYRPQIGSFEEAASEVGTAVSRSVRSQMIADVPVGTLLSGGIDSTCLTALASKHGNQNFGALRTFTLGFDQPESDERQYAEVAARHYGTAHHVEILRGSQLPRQLQEAIEAFDEPFDPNGPLPATRLARLVCENETKVVLGGDGGDELFAGYLRYDAFNELRSSRISRLAARIGLGRYERSGLSQAKAYFQQEGVCTPKMLAAIMPSNFSRQWLERSMANTRSYFESDLPPVVACQLLDLNHYLPGHILTKVDRATMHYGVETRVPLLRRQTVELAFRIPSEINYRGGERKAVLKHVAGQYLPPQLVSGRKKGFSSPMGSWTSPRMLAWGREKLRFGLLASTGMARPDAADSLLARKSHKCFRAFWLLLAAELWAERWLENDPQRPPIATQIERYELVN